MRSRAAGSASFEKRTTGFTHANLCAAGAMRETLQLESGVKILRHNIEGHFARLTVRHRPKGEADRMFIGDVSPVFDLPIRFIPDHLDHFAHALHVTLPTGDEFPFSITEKTVFFRKGQMAFNSRL